MKIVRLVVDHHNLFILNPKKKIPKNLLFPASNLPQLAIREQARRWRFEYLSEADKIDQAAVLAAANFITKNRDNFLPKVLPNHPAVLANLALKVHHIFLEEAGEPTAVTRTASETAQAILKILDV